MKFEISRLQKLPCLSITTKEWTTNAHAQITNETLI